MKIALIALRTLGRRGLFLETAQLLGAGATIDVEREQARVDQGGTKVHRRATARDDRRIVAPEPHGRRHVLSEPEGIEPVGTGRRWQRRGLRWQLGDVCARSVASDDQALTR